MSAQDDSQIYMLTVVDGSRVTTIINNLYAFTGDLSAAGVMLRLGAGLSEDDAESGSRSADALIGYQYLLDGWKIRTFAGVTYVLRDDEDGELGGKLVVQAQTGKSDEVYVNAGLSYSTASDVAAGSLQVGGHVSGDLILGPDLALSSNGDSTGVRAGLFLTGMKLGDVSLSLRGGYKARISDEETTPGYYSGVSASLQY